MSVNDGQGRANLANYYQIYKEECLENGDKIGIDVRTFQTYFGHGERLLPLIAAGETSLSFMVTHFDMLRKVQFTLS